jgi:catechol 2,3-dioxygenase-like lactoylglutathione lyase family enzyme
VLDHLTLGASDREASRRFYATVLPVLGLDRVADDPAYVEWGDLSIAQAGEGRPVTRGLHVGFAAASAEQVEAFWRAGIEAGFRDGGPPGPRPRYGPDYVGGFLLDPDGNSIEAALHDGVVASGIDHVWLRVRDLEASRRFLDGVAGAVGLREVAREPALSRYRRAPGESSLTVVAAGDDPVTTPVHLAFGVPDRAAVERFHADALAAGAADNGPPGERPQYHPGYVGAFVLDPDGHNVEAVFHGRR